MLPKFIGVKWIVFCLAIPFVLYAALSSTATARVGAKCGGVAGVSCGRGEFCELPPGYCPQFRRDLEGTCVENPGQCLRHKILRVCGCNWITYDNDCFRRQARVTL